MGGQVELGTIDSECTTTGGAAPLAHSHAPPPSRARPFPRPAARPRTALLLLAAVAAVASTCAARCPAVAPAASVAAAAGTGGFIRADGIPAGVSCADGIPAGVSCVDGIPGGADTRDGGITDGASDWAGGNASTSRVGGIPDGAETRADGIPASAGLGAGTAGANVRGAGGIPTGDSSPASGAHGGDSGASAPRAPTGAARLSDVDRAALAGALPRARGADDVRRSLAARRRRLNRHGRVAVLKFPARAVDERYELCGIDAPAHRAPSPTEYDPARHAQLGIDGVADAVEAVAARGVLSAHDLARAVVSALSWKPSRSPRAPQKGATPVASPLNAAAIYELAVADPTGLPPGLSAEALRDGVTHGADAMYCGARRQGTTHNSAPPSREAAAALRAGHDADVAAGWVLDITEIAEACPLMPLLLVGLRQVPKSFAADGVTVTAWRTIADASGDVGVGSNWDVDPSALHPVPLHTMAEVAAELHRVKSAAGAERVVFGAFDYAKAYRQFPNRVDDMWLHCYCLDGRVFADLRIAFGSRAGGQWLCAVSHLVARAVSRELGTDGACVCFVDDSGLIVVERAFPRAEALFRALAARVGLTINEGKVLPPSTRQRFIGPEWCTESMRIYLPEVKVALLCADLETAAAAPSMRCRDLLSLLQRMQWASQMVLVLASCQAPVRALIRGAPLAANITLSAAARDAMRACVEMLRTGNGSTVVPRAALRDGAPEYYSDASSTGVGWVCYETRRYASEALPAGSAAALSHINALELSAASAAALDLHAQRSAAGTPPAAILGHIDNTAACACLSSLGTSSLTLAPGTRAIATAAAHLRFTPLASWVQSAANPADAPSRGVIPPELAGWTRVRYSEAALAQWGAPADWRCLLSSPPA